MGAVSGRHDGRADWFYRIGVSRCESYESERYMKFAQSFWRLINRIYSHAPSQVFDLIVHSELSGLESLSS